ncbi:MAG: NAD(P)/FAD-dependent oxidoreductase [Candidatus Neomarinimicrobiota bacterium]
MDKKNYFVVGAGMAGLTATNYLAKAGLNVTLFEQASQCGGLVNSFERNGFIYDGGIRSMEDSGILFPMLKNLGLDIEWLKSQVSIGLEKDILRLNGLESVNDYEEFLRRNFTDSQQEITHIIKTITKIMSYMDILYGIENPIFKDIKNDPKYATKVLLPWLFKYIRVIPKILKMHQPVEEFILKLSQDQKLNDNICQHFFTETPAFFALSYFSLYLDYHYPKGGTGVLPRKLEENARSLGADIRLNTAITHIDPDNKTLTDQHGNIYDYDAIIWAANLKNMYKAISCKNIKKDKVRQNVQNMKDKLESLRGGESVLSVYLALDQSVEHFRKICSEHLFYTADKTGLSTVDRKAVDNIIESGKKDTHSKQKIKDYLKLLLERNTFEISIPAMRDPHLAPEGKTAFVISILFDHKLTQYIKDMGWYDEFKIYIEDITVDILSKSIFPDLDKHIIDKFSSTPISMERLTANLDGALTGWAFDKQDIPVPHKITDMFDSYKTPLAHIYQAGQWTFSPAGFPIAIFTGKRAADMLIKKSL